MFVQVFKAIGTFRGESKLSTWIYRIAINLCKNRAKYLRVRHTGRAGRARGGGRARASSERGAARERRAGRASGRGDRRSRRSSASCRSAIREIEESFRECLVLRDVEELSYEEIGRSPGLPRGYSEEQDPPRARDVARDGREASSGRRSDEHRRERDDEGRRRAEREAAPRGSRLGAMRALLKRAIDAGGARDGRAELLPAVQRKMRKRSKGKFYADGWSTAQRARQLHARRDGHARHRRVAYFALGPDRIRPRNEPLRQSSVIESIARWCCSR